MSYFDKDFLQYFKDLAANNNRDWFHANKKRYEKSVKKPFEAFTSEMISRMKKLDKTINIEPKDAIFRIARDVRFSKDKTPYKTNISAIVSSGGRKDFSKIGVYYELGPEDLRVYSGLYFIEKDALHQIRSHINNNMNTFNKLINAKSFVEKFGEVRGDKNVRLEKEFQSTQKVQPLIANKSFYYFNKFNSKMVTESNLIDTFIDYYKAAIPLNKFLEEASVN